MLVLAYVASPDLRHLLTSQAGGVTIQWMPAPIASPREAVVYIADARPASLVVEMQPEVLPWLSLVRSDPATRRLPLVALVANAEAEAAAMSVRANAIVNPAQLAAPTRLGSILADHARPDADHARLADQCAGAPPPLVLKGLHEFNTGDFYECHETLEHAWMEETGPVRDVYRAILQIGVAYYQITRGNYRGAHKMFVRAVQWIAPLPDRCHGIDIAQLRADAAAARAHLEALGEANLRQFDRALLRPILVDAADAGTGAAHD
jgi:hypothetical protein